MINAALKEVNELKAKLNDYHEITAELIGGADDDGVFDVCISRMDYELLTDHFNKTPAQCLKQHNIALLNDIEQTYANGADIDFCDYFACYKVNLELDNEIR